MKTGNFDAFFREKCLTKNNNRAASQFLRAGACGEPIVMKSGGDQLRSYCHALDCASAILTVLLHGERGNAYNISNRESVCTVLQFAQAVADATGVEILFEEPTDQEKGSYNLMGESSLDAKKLEQLGWRGMFDLQHGVEDALRVLQDPSEEDNTFERNTLTMAREMALPAAACTCGDER